MFMRCLKNTVWRISRSGLPRVWLESANYEDVNSYLEQGSYIAQAYPLILSTGVIDRYYHYCFLDKKTPTYAQTVKVTSDLCVTD